MSIVFKYKMHDEGWSEERVMKLIDFCAAECDMEMQLLLNAMVASHFTLKSGEADITKDRKDKLDSVLRSEMLETVRNENLPEPFKQKKLETIAWILVWLGD